MKRIISLILALSLTVGVAFALSSCASDGGDGKTAFVSIDINPSVELTVEDGKVVGVYGANEDGQILLYGEELKGLSVEEAAKKITEDAIMLGYIDENNTVVNTTVSSADGKYAEKLEKKLTAKIESTADGEGIEVKVSLDGAYSVKRRLDELKKEYPDNAKIQALTVSEFRLILSASENGEITVEAAVELDKDALIAKINEHHKNIDEFATAAFLEAKRLLDEGYVQAEAAAMEAVYIAYYAKNILTHPTTCYYGVLYQSYATASRTLDFAADAMSAVNKVSDYPLNEEQIASVLTALGLSADDVSLIQNSNGEVTLRSVEAYVDKTFKNSPEGEALTAIKAELSTALSNIDGELETLRRAKIEEYADEIAALKETVNGLIDTVTAFLPATVKTAVQEIIGEYRTMLDETARMFEDGTVTVAEVRELADKFASKASDIKDKINGDLSETEFAEIKEAQDNVKNTMSAKKAELDRKLASLEASAKAELEALRQKRLAVINTAG